MKLVAKNHNFAHLVEQERQTKSIVVKASGKINFQSETATIVTPLDKKNLQKVCEYYRYANYRVTIAIDSQNFRKDAVRILQENYLGLGCSVFDLSISESLPHPKNAKLEYLCKAFELTRSGNLAQLAAKIAIIKIPFVFSCAKQCAAAYIQDDSLKAPFIRCLERKIERVKEAVERDFKINSSDNYQRVDSLRGLELSQLPSTTAIIAATGVGKTSYVYTPIARSASADKNVTYISHLISLVEQFCLEVSCASYQEQDLMKLGQANSMGSVINSIWKPHLFEKICSSHTLLIDEFEKVYKTLVCSENSRTMQADRVFDALVHILKTVPRVIVADADLTDNSLSFLKQIRGELSVIECAENPYKTLNATILNKKELLNSKQIRTVLERDKVFLFDNLQTLKQVVGQLGYQNHLGLDCETKALNDGVLVLHSDNRDMPAQKAFLKDPNREVTKYKAVIASPCLGAGFSIIENYTNTVNVICESTLIPRELVNFSRRFRCAKEYNFWCGDLKSSRNNQSNDCLEKHRHSHLGLRYTERLKFERQKRELNEHLALSMRFTLEKLGFEASCKNSMQHHTVVSTHKRQFDAEFKARQQIAVVEAVEITPTEFAIKQRCNALSSIDLAEVRKFEIKMVYNLDKINLEHVKFDDNFDRELFAHLPFVLDKPSLVRLAIYSRQKEYIANLISLVVFDGYNFEEEKSNHFLFKSSVADVLRKMDGDGLDLYFPPQLKFPSLGKTEQTYKATSYLKALLTKLGFVLGRYGGKEQKARVSVSPLAKEYKIWLRNASLKPVAGY
ncbi:hypothetical protein NB520_09510 [Vibrio antiquarius]|uniref:hypothetical protein n=1 Tax=Vibrio antiquarius (strain Ex25) TaxID=150340 RepID=UPI0026592E51|nr:hypothetical protein [Vibrio antiquarius]MCR9629064.1 hypothetical protein [Vibrio antiquarius]MCR9631750.1 hypothetical protein [Vibrio antiquarius]